MNTAEFMKATNIPDRKTLDRYIKRKLLHPVKQNGVLYWTTSDVYDIVEYRRHNSRVKYTPDETIDTVNRNTHLLTKQATVELSRMVEQLSNVVTQQSEQIKALEAKMQHLTEKLDSHIFKSTVLKGTKYGYSKDKASSSQPSNTNNTTENTQTDQDTNTDQKPAHKPKDPKYPIGTLTPKMQQWAKDAKPLTPTELREWELQMYGFIEDDE